MLWGGCCPDSRPQRCRSRTLLKRAQSWFPESTVTILQRTVESLFLKWNIKGHDGRIKMAINVSEYKMLLRFRLESSRPRSFFGLCNGWVGRAGFSTSEEMRMFSVEHTSSSNRNHCGCTETAGHDRGLVKANKICFKKRISLKRGRHLIMKQSCFWFLQEISNPTSFKSDQF